MKKRNDIWDEFRRMQERMENMFNDFLKKEHFQDKNYKIFKNFAEPRADILDEDDEIITEIELPGFNKEDIHVMVSENGIEVKAQNKSEYEMRKKNAYKMERNFSGFYRKFSLPSNVDYENAKTEYKNGILTVRVPKLKVKKKMIQIKQI